MLYCDYRVVVIAGSIEGLAAVVRLINSLSSVFPIPLVACVHGLLDEAIDILASKSMENNAGLRGVSASDGDRLLSGHLYIVQAGSDVSFSSEDVLSISPSLKLGKNYSSADMLFESAAHIYGHSAIGVVLSGNGDDGTRGLLALFKVGGCSVVQSTSEAQFSGMPYNAIINDHVAHLVLLDQIGKLLIQLVGQPHQ